MISMVLLALAAPAAAPAPAAPPRALACHLPGITYVNKGKRVTRPQKLGEMPPASEYLAVVRHVGGCPEPAIVRTGIGSGGR